MSLLVTVPAQEYYEEVSGKFITTEEYELEVEHSLISLAKWEAKWKKPFLSKKDKSTEETLDYIRCMTIKKSKDLVYEKIPQSCVDQIISYIHDPMTATIFPQPDKKVTQKETITAELVYYWMIAFNVPFDCRKWHLNQLLTLINICSIKNQPPKKLSAKDKQNKLLEMQKLNNQRLAETGSHG